MGLFDHFPYTNFHELNLDWIMKEIGKYDEIITSFKNWQEESEADYQQILTRVNQLDADMSGFKTEIENDFAQLSTQLQAQINALDIQSQNRLNAAIADFQNQINQLIHDTQTQISALEADINRAILELDGRMDANNQLIRNYVEFRLQEFLDNFPSVYDLPVYNPVQGLTTDINTALKDLYDMIRADGALTALEYDQLNLSAADYDALGLTAFQYDTNARYLLHFPDLRWMMIDPFTGLYELIGTVVQKLANLHKNALTASAYDAKQLTADDYDALSITAYNYDWNGATLIP